MECEKFDRVVLDLLYDELDELTNAAARRHMDHCGRCQHIGSKLRATREVGVVPLVDPPSGLKERILAAESQARAGLGPRQRLGRAITILASYAMRPQVAMAALLLLMLGGSLFFLRARPGDLDQGRVTERGVPEQVAAPDPGHVPLPEETFSGSAKLDEAQEDQPETEAVAEQSQVDEEDKPATYEAALRDFQAHRYAKAERKFDAVAEQGGEQALAATLYAARAALSHAGCVAALPRLEHIRTEHPQTAVATEATYYAASCYQKLGDAPRARAGFQSLLENDSFGDRARAELAAMKEPASVASASPARASTKSAARSIKAAGSDAGSQVQPEPARETK